MKKLLLLLLLSLGLLSSADGHINANVDIDVRVFDSVILFEYEGSKFELPFCEFILKSECKKSSIQPSGDTIKAEVIHTYRSIDYEEYLYFKTSTCCQSRPFEEEVKGYSYFDESIGAHCFKKREIIHEPLVESISKDGKCKIEKSEMRRWVRKYEYSFSIIEFEYEDKLFLSNRFRIPALNNTEPPLCASGYKKSGNLCVKKPNTIKIPANSHADGNSWTCNTSYYKDGSVCRSVHENAYSNYNSNYWYCSTGYYKSGNRCVKKSNTIKIPAKKFNTIKIPANSHADGNSWTCNTSYYKDGSVCRRVPENAYSSYNSNYWYCKSGYRKSGSSCKSAKANEVENDEIKELKIEGLLL